MRLVFFDKFRLPLQSLERLELLNLKDENYISLVSVWLEKLISARLYKCLSPPKTH